MNHYELLEQYRSNLCVPHRLPEAVRYFIWHHLDAPETAGHLDLVNPIRIYDSSIMAFADRTVLVLPDRIYHDPATWRVVMENAGALNLLHSIESTITTLAAETNPFALCELAAGIFKWLLDSGASGYINDVYDDFWNTLCTILTNSFRRGWCDHLQTPNDFSRFAKYVRELHATIDDDGIKADIALWLQNELGRLHSQRCDT